MFPSDMEIGLTEGEIVAGREIFGANGLRCFSSSMVISSALGAVEFLLLFMAARTFVDVDGAS